MDLVEGSKLTNVAIDTGTSFPSSPDTGELFYLTSGNIGLYVYTGSSWELGVPQDGQNEIIFGTTKVEIPSSDGDIVHTVAGSEEMRLNSTGLAIGLGIPTNLLTIGAGSFAAPASGSGNFYATATNGLVISGNGSTSDVLLVNSSGQTGISVDSSANVGIGTTSPLVRLDVTTNSSDTVAKLTSTSPTNLGSNLVLSHDSASPATDDIVGRVSFEGKDSTDASLFYAQIRGNIEDTTNGSEDGYMTFHTTSGGTLSEQVRLTSTGRLLLQSGGSAAAPVISVDNDTDSGVYGGADTLGLATAGLSRLFIDASGHVGIGTASPENTLHIKDTTDPVIVFERDGSSARSDILVGSDGSMLFRADPTNVVASSTIRFQIDGSEHVRILDSGNVGIGTNAPDTPLEVVGITKLSGRDDLQLSIVNALETQNWYLQNRVDGTFQLRDQTYGNNVVEIQAQAPNNSLFITATTGKVGIGTNSPSNKLQVNGDNTDTLNDSDVIHDDTSNSFIRIQNNNNVGAAQEAGIIFQSKQADAAAAAVYLQRTGTNTGDLIFRIRDGASTSDEILRIKSDGTIDGNNNKFLSSYIPDADDVLANKKYVDDQVIAGGTTLGGLTDVTLTSLTSGQLFYSNDGANWVNAPELFWNETGNVLNPGTADASDTSQLSLAGGGIADSGRGSYVATYGNEHTTQAGDLFLVGGAAANSEIRIINVSTSGIVTAYTSNTERMRIDSSGNVGVGTTSPGGEFHVRGTNIPTLGIGASDSSGAQVVIDGSSNGDLAGSDYAYLRHRNDGHFEINNLTANDIIFFTNAGNERLRILSGGNVGIDTLAPTKLLEVGPGGDSFATADEGIGANVAGNAAVIARNSTDDVEVNMRALSTGIGVIGTETSHNTQIRSAGAPVIVATTTGNVAIGGSTVPNARLDVSDSIGSLPTFNSDDVIIARNNGTTATNAAIAIIAGTAANSRVVFGDADAKDSGSVIYNHSSNILGLGVNGSPNLYTFSSTNLTLPGDPTSALHAVTKQYADALAAGLDPKKSVRAATTGNLTGYSPTGGTAGSGGFTNIDTTAFDGHSNSVNDRILVLNQTDPKENGIYIVTVDNATTGAMERASDHDGTPLNEVSGGNTVFVENGTTYSGRTYVLQGNGTLTLNTNDLDWELLSNATDWTWGNGLTNSGNIVSVDQETTGTAGTYGTMSVPSGKLAVDLGFTSTVAMPGNAQLDQLNGISLSGISVGQLLYRSNNVPNEWANTSNLYWDESTDSLGVGANPDTKLHISESDTNTATVLTIGNDTTPSTVNDKRIVFQDGTGTTEGTNKFTYAGIQGLRTGGSNSGALLFLTKTDNVSAPDEKMRVDEDGNVGIGVTADSARRLHVYHATENVNLKVESGDVESYIEISDSVSSGEVFVGNSSGDLVLLTSNTERMKINSSGNVSVGAASVVSRLAVKQSGTAATSGLRIEGDADDSVLALFKNATHWNIIAGFNSTGSYQDIAFTTGGSEALRIDTSGDVGIGTTTPQNKLHIQDGAVTGATYRGSAPLAIERNGDCELQIIGTGAAQIRFGDGASNFAGAVSYDHPTDSLRLYTSGSERMQIDSLGNVGIGTLAPGAKLHVSGGACLFDNNFGLNFKDSGGTSRNGIVWDASDKLNLYSGTDNAIKFTIDTNGNVGIGTTTPSCKLDVDGEICGTQITGPTYAQTSTSGTTSIVDTGITVAEGEIYEVMIVGNPNDGGSSAYRDIIKMTVFITCGFETAVKKWISVVQDFSRGTIHGSAGGPLTADAVMLNATTEYTNVAQSTATTLRIKVDGYAGTVGDNQTVRVTRIL